MLHDRDCRKEDALVGSRASWIRVLIRTVNLHGVPSIVAGRTDKTGATIKNRHVPLLLHTDDLAKPHSNKRRILTYYQRRLEG